MSNINDFVIEDGVLVEYTGEDTDVVIPDSVTELGDWCFNGCESLESITIPDSVTSLGDDCFAGCDDLTIYAEEGSAAAEYAKKNGIKLELI